MSPLLPAVIFSLLIGLVALFQLALAAGMPWGSAAMGGRFPGKLPPAMRVMAVVQIGVLALVATIVLARAGLLLPDWDELSRTAIWGVVAFSSLATVLNSITPSRLERRLWAPVAVGLLACSLLVALGR